jgi:hypothetical protein
LPETPERRHSGAATHRRADTPAHSSLPHDPLRRKRFDKPEAKVDARFEKVDERFGKIDERFESLSKDISGIRVSLASATVWAITLYMALAGTMLYVMARGFKWL